VDHPVSFADGVPRRLAPRPLTWIVSLATKPMFAHAEPISLPPDAFEREVKKLLDAAGYQLGGYKIESSPEGSWPRRCLRN
jgi:hypothetical protein